MSRICTQVEQTIQLALALFLFLVKAFYKKTISFQVNEQTQDIDIKLCLNDLNRGPAVLFP